MTSEQPGNRARHLSAGSDWGHALESVQDDRQLLREVVEAFLDECPQFMSQLTTAVVDGKAEVVKRMAHTIKGSSRVFDMAELTVVAQRVEDIGQSGDLADAQTAVPTLATLLDQAVVEFEQYVRDNP